MKKIKKCKFHIHKIDYIKLTKCGLNTSNRLMVLLEYNYIIEEVKKDKSICKKCLNILENEYKKEYDESEEEI